MSSTAFPLLFKLTTVDTVKSLNSQMGPCEHRTDRGVLCRRGHSPSNVNQISCRCSWINDLHQWRALTVNMPVSYPTPTLLHCIFPVFVLQIPPFACEKRLAVFEQESWKKCSTGLYPSLPASGNQHHATSRSRGSASQHNTLQHLFCFAGWRRMGGAGGGIDRAAFIELLQSWLKNTWALWATGSNTASIRSIHHARLAA